MVISECIWFSILYIQLVHYLGHFSFGTHGMCLIIMDSSDELDSPLNVPSQLILLIICTTVLLNGNIYWEDLLTIHY